MRNLYKAQFYILIAFITPAAVSAAEWIVRPTQTDVYSVLKSNNEPGIAIASTGFYGLSTSPRYTTRFDPANLQLHSGEQVGNMTLPAATYYADAFIMEGSPLSQPLLKFDARNTTPASYVNTVGFKKQLWQQDTLSPALASLQFGFGFFPIFSNNANTEFTIRSCWTTTNYDVNSAECVNSANAFAQQRKYIYKKSYDFVFNQQQATATIMIDSDGSSNIIDNATGCRTTTVNNTEGVMCHLFKFLPTQYVDDVSTRLTVGYSLVRNDARLANLTESDVLVSANNGSTWTGLERGVYINNYPIRNDDIYVFFSSSFFSKISAIDLNTFNINNAFYLGLARNINPLNHFDITLPISSNIRVIPRTTHATITAHTSGYQEGNVGKNVITFPYSLQESGPTSAEQLEISISQDRGTTFNNKCTFYPSNTTEIQQGVPIDTYISFETLSNGKIKKSILCDNLPLELRQLGIKDSQAPVYGTDEFNTPSVSRFYNLDLLFDLTGSSGSLTTTGQNWEGQVEQTGRITFTAIWK